MSETKWTEGEWHVVTLAGQAQIVGIIRDQQRSTGGVPVEVIAKVIDGPRAAANAHLLANSKKLYEALAALVADLPAVSNYALLENARAALSAARGGSDV